MSKQFSQLLSKCIVVLSLVALLPLASVAQTATDPNLKVAFFGDQGVNANAVAVMQMVKLENPQLVVHLGDFDYLDNPATWETQLNSVLGANYPYIAVVGNHDLPHWSDATTGYKARLLSRLARTPQITCSGDYGVNAACNFKGLRIVLSGVGTLGTNHAAYIKSALASSNSIWEVCAWHKNQQKMQIGGKLDEVGWDAYEECRKGGAIITTGHEHSYERTKTLVDMTNQIVDPSCSSTGSLCVSPGRTFNVVSGLAGNSVRVQLLCLPTIFPYGCKQEWASIYTSDQAATYGALFIVFNVNGDPRKAHGYFKNINGAIIDSFDIVKTDAVVPKSPVNLRVAP